MSDDLVRRLRHEENSDMATHPVGLLDEAADRIEALEKTLGHIYAWYPISVTQPRQTIDDIREFARAALGQKKDD
jgi:hypothetical protein